MVAFCAEIIIFRDVLFHILESSKILNVIFNQKRKLISSKIGCYVRKSENNFDILENEFDIPKEYGELLRWRSFNIFEVSWTTRTKVMRK